MSSLCLICAEFVFDEIGITHLGCAGLEKPEIGLNWLTSFMFEHGWRCPREGLMKHLRMLIKLERLIPTMLKYDALRKRLLVDPHISKDGSTPPNLVMDNPLSESPDSMWGHFFRNAELEKLLDQDLSRLYPEHGSYFHTLGCQSMLRRSLVLWCLRHPEYGYRQGMHELLAPLMYVIHADLQQLTEACKHHEGHFTNKFDDALFQENDLAYNFDFRRSRDFMVDDANLQEKTKKTVSLDELEPEIQTIVSLSDPYGAEGELGVVLSEKFMEHDVYCMFDALMSGAGRAVAMAEFFSPSTGLGTQTSLSPVIEASSALYHLLFVIDSLGDVQGKASFGILMYDSILVI